ncbi:MAG: ribonuclease P protein component 1 [Nitrososphaera sp.]|jgi:ribonuclease P protein subunit POP4
MTVDCQNILCHEIIGLHAKILESSDSTLQGSDGTIVFETKNTMLIRKDSIVRQISKGAAKRLLLRTPSCVCFISGSALIGRPEDRIARLNNR